MESTPEAQEGLLTEDSLRQSDSSFTVVATPTSPFTSIHRRPVYQRLNSSADTDARRHSAEGDHRDDEGLGGATAAQGLAIQNVETARRVSIQRVPVEAKAKASPVPPRSPDPVSSSLSSRLSTKSTPLYDGISETLEGDLLHKTSKPSLHDPFVADTESEHLYKMPSASTMRSIDPPGMASLFPKVLARPNLSLPVDFIIRSSATLTNTPFIDAPDSKQHCTAKNDISQGRGNWLFITIMILAVYSTVLSGIWLMIAITKPRYGQKITSNHGKLAPNTASLLCAAFAKTIELSFVTVFVAFLGQVLSRRAIMHSSRGITIAEMSMRSWVMQPGTLITHWESVRYAGTTFLGAIALTGALMAMLYTTASDALGRSHPSCRSPEKLAGVPYSFASDATD